MDKNKAEKIKQYEGFIQNTLKVDLKEIQDNLERKHGEELKWVNVVKLSKMLQLYKEQVDQKLRMYSSILKIDTTVVNEVYSLMEIKNVDRLYIKIGCNCLLEMDLVEAEKYANIRIKMINKQINHFQQLAVQIKVKKILLFVGGRSQLITEL